MLTSPTDASFAVVCFNTFTLALRCLQGASTPSLTDRDARTKNEPAALELQISASQ